MTRYPVFAPEDHPFTAVMVDITHRCNMNCANCYIPDRTIPDMDASSLIDCIAKFPRKTLIRIAGAEATLHPKLPWIIRQIKSLGHRPVLLTNGLRLASVDYAAELKSAGLRYVYISMNGADNDDWYEAIDNLRCANKKLRALDNAIDARMIVNTGTIVARGINEPAIAEMANLLQSRAPRHALLRFRNIGAVGRHMDMDKRHMPWDELIATISAQLGVSVADIQRHSRIENVDEKDTRLFPLEKLQQPGKGIWVKVTNWTSNDEGALHSRTIRRGRITHDFRIAPFFEEVFANR